MYGADADFVAKTGRILCSFAVSFPPANLFDNSILDYLASPLSYSIDEPGIAECSRRMPTGSDGSDETIRDEISWMMRLADLLVDRTIDERCQETNKYRAKDVNGAHAEL